MTSPALPRNARFAAIAAAVTLGAAASASAADFAPGPDLAIGPNGDLTDAAAGDFNSDGIRDLLVVDRRQGQVLPRLGNGDGTFRPGDDVRGLRDASGAVVADLNADGREDVALVAGVGTKFGVVTLLGRGDGSFVAGPAYPLTNMPFSLVVADFNLDGREDIAARNSDGFDVRLQQPDGTYAQQPDVRIAGAPQAAAVDDVDGDGVEDLLASTAQPTQLVVSLGRGDGTFRGEKTTGLPNVGKSIAVGDVNADGRPDVVAAIAAENRISVRLGKGDGTFTDTVADIPTGANPRHLALGDVTGDDRVDVVVTTMGADAVQVHAGQGDGSFAAADPVPVGASPLWTVIGDVDADGRDDLAVVNVASGSLSIRRNTGPAATGNLLVNGGFEQGLGARLPGQAPAIPGWTTTGGATFVRYGIAPTTAFPTHVDAPRWRGGLQLFSGGLTGGAPATTAVQTVDVADRSAEIDAGRVTADLSAYLGGVGRYEDGVTVTAEFLDGQGNPAKSLAIGPVGIAERAGATTLVRRAGTEAVPAGTRAIRVRLTATDAGADGRSWASADNVRLAQTTSPEPQADPDPDPTATPGTFGARTQVSLRVLRHVRGAKVLRVRVRNGNAFPVIGTMRGRGRRRLGAVPVAVPAGGVQTVEVALPRPVRRALTKRRVTVRFTATVADEAGGERTIAVRSVR